MVVQNLKMGNLEMIVSIMFICVVAICCGAACVWVCKDCRRENRRELAEMERERRFQEVYEKALATGCNADRIQPSLAKHAFKCEVCMERQTYGTPLVKLLSNLIVCHSCALVTSEGRVSSLSVESINSLALAESL